MYLNKSYSSSSITAQNFLPQFYLCGFATHSTKYAEVLLHAHVKDPDCGIREILTCGIRNLKKKVLLMDSAIMGFGIRNIVQRIRNLTDALTIRIQNPISTKKTGIRSPLHACAESMTVLDSQLTRARHYGKALFLQGNTSVALCLI